MARFNFIPLLTLLSILSPIKVKAEDNISLEWKDESCSEVDLFPGDVYDIKQTLKIVPEGEDVYYEIVSIDNPYSMTISDDGVITVTKEEMDCDVEMFIKSYTNKTTSLPLSIHIHKTGTDLDEDTDEDESDSISIYNKSLDEITNDIIDLYNENTIADSTLSELNALIEQKVKEKENSDYWWQVYLDELAKAKQFGMSGDEDDDEEYDCDDDEDYTPAVQDAGYKTEIIENDYDYLSDDEEEIELKKSKITKIKKKKKGALQIKFKDIDDADEYEIDISRYSDFRTFIRYKADDNIKTIKSLKKNKTYYIRVRAINGDIKGDWSTSKKIKTAKK